MSLQLENNIKLWTPPIVFTIHDNMGTVSPSGSMPAIPPFPPFNFNPLDLEIEKRLDPAFVEYYKQKIDIKLATHQVPLKQVRENPKDFIPPWQVKALRNVRIFDSSLTDLTGRRIPIRIYEPNPEKFGSGPYGVHINFHGTLCFCKMFQNTKANVTLVRRWRFCFW
jgi:hypothetical protein